MKPTPAAILAFALLGAGTGRAADATSPVDPAQRNAPFAPAATVTPAKKSPAAQDNRGVQDRRFETGKVEFPTAPLAGRRAPIDVQEVREKQVRSMESHRPESTEQPTSRFNHREAAISTGADTTKPPLVAKYQDSLSAASAANMARFPALDQATTAKINRFVFRKNAAEPASPVDGAKVTPAAGGSSVRR